MNIQSAFDSGVAGFNQANERAAQSAREIAQQQAPSQSPTAASEVGTELASAVPKNTPITESLINLRVAENEARTSSKVIETADNVLGSLIDTRV
jgi:hypothetical protein